MRSSPASAGVDVSRVTVEAALTPIRNMLATLAAILACGCAPADAPRPLSYDCDTPPGRLSELEQVQPGPAYRISGRIRPDDLRPDKRWEPAGNVFVESADEQDRVMLQLVAPEREPPLSIVLRSHHGEKNDLRTLGQIGLGEEVPFTLTIAGGRAKIGIGDIKTEIAVDLGKDARVGVGCSAGTFRFEALEFGV
jgi:hypothetical protein